MVVVIWLSPEVFMRLPRRLSPRRPLTAEGCLDSMPSALLPVLLCLAKGGALRVIWPDSRMPLVVRLNGWGPSPSAASSLFSLANQLIGHAGHRKWGALGGACE